MEEGVLLEDEVQETKSLDSWPPVAHIIHKKDEPAREGTIALCGAKLMGIELGRLKDFQGEACKECVEVLRRILG